MKPADAIKACGNENSIRVVTKSGAEYILEKEVIQEWSRNIERPYVYGYRSNGHPRNRNNVKWFHLANVELAS